MTRDVIPDRIKLVDPEQLRRNLFYLSKAPLPYRKLNYTIPGHATNTLYEADDFIQQKPRIVGIYGGERRCSSPTIWVRYI